MRVIVLLSLIALVAANPMPQTFVGSANIQHPAVPELFTAAGGQGLQGSGLGGSQGISQGIQGGSNTDGLGGLSSLISGILQSIWGAQRPISIQGNLPGNWPGAQGGIQQGGWPSAGGIGSGIGGGSQGSWPNNQGGGIGGIGGSQGGGIGGICAQRKIMPIFV